MQYQDYAVNAYQAQSAAVVLIMLLHKKAPKRTDKDYSHEYIHNDTFYWLLLVNVSSIQKLTDSSFINVHMI